jgi:ribosome biogenesis protein UTP30
MAKTDLIDSHVSAKQCTRAVHALHSYALKKQKEQEENELLPSNEQYVWLQITVKRMHPEHKIKPFKIPLKHPLIDPRVTPICLITKDPQREYKDLLESHKIKFISRVVGITKLKGKFKSYEARRMLLKENGMFLADERVIPLLPGLLGKKWFDAKKKTANPGLLDTQRPQG